LLDEKGRSGAKDRPSAEAPFSDLINRWLDEGDRISEVARTGAPGPQHKERPFLELVRGLRAKADRHRFTVVIVAVTLSAIAIASMRAVSHAVLKSTPTIAAERPAPPPASVAAPAAPTPAADPTAPKPVVAAPVAAVESPPAAAPAADPPMSPRAAVAPAAAAKPHEAPPPAVTSAPEVPQTAARRAPVKKLVSASDRSPLEACQSALRGERVREALSSCQRLAEENPKSVDAMVLMAHADLLAGRDAETLRLARRAAALDPKNADAYLHIGNVQQAAGRASEARAAYDAYLRAAPRGAHANEVRAVLKTL